MRLASFNVENLFRRPKVINTAGWATGEGRQVLAAYAALEDLFQQAEYTAADKKGILELLGTLGLLKSDESQCGISAPQPGAAAAPTEERPGGGHRGRPRRLDWLA